MELFFRFLIAMTDFIGVAIFFFLSLVILLFGFIFNLFPCVRRRKAKKR